MEDKQKDLTVTSAFLVIVGEAADAEISDAFQGSFANTQLTTPAAR